MKKIIILLIIPFLISCSEREVPFENLVVRNDPELGTRFFEVNSNTPFSGITRQYHDNGQLMVEHRLRNGIPLTGSSFFHDNGQLSHVELLDENGLLTGEVTYYDFRGSVRRIVEYLSGIPYGFFTMFFDSGEISSEGFFLTNNYTDFYSVRHLPYRGIQKLSDTISEGNGLTVCFYHDLESLQKPVTELNVTETIWYIDDPDKEIYSTMNYFTDCPGDFELTENKMRLN